MSWEATARGDQGTELIESWIRRNQNMDLGESLFIERKAEMDVPLEDRKLLYDGPEEKRDFEGIISKRKHYAGSF